MKTKQEAIEIRRIYSETGGNVSETARQCGCGRDTVRRALVRDYSTNEGRKHRIHAHEEDRMIERVILENAADAMRSKKLRMTATRIAHIVQAEGCKLSEQIFIDPKLTEAIVDRMVHYSHFIQFSGESYRVKHSLLLS